LIGQDIEFNILPYCFGCKFSWNDTQPKYNYWLLDKLCIYLVSFTTYPVQFYSIWASLALSWAGFVKSGRAEYLSRPVYPISCQVLPKADKRSTYPVRFTPFLVRFYQKLTSGAPIPSGLPHFLSGFIKSWQAEYLSRPVYPISCQVLAKAGERSAFLVGFYKKTADFIKKIANIALILVVCCHKTAVKSTIAYGTDFKFIRQCFN